MWVHWVLGGSSTKSTICVNACFFKPSKNTFICSSNRRPLVEINPNQNITQNWSDWSHLWAGWLVTDTSKDETMKGEPNIRLPIDHYIITEEAVLVLEFQNSWSCLTLLYSYVWYHEPLLIQQHEMSTHLLCVAVEQKKRWRVGEGSAASSKAVCLVWLPESLWKNHRTYPHQSIYSDNTHALHSCIHAHQQKHPKWNKLRSGGLRRHSWLAALSPRQGERRLHWADSVGLCSWGSTGTRLQIKQPWLLC